MEPRIDPSSSLSTTRRGHIGKATLRLVVCIAVVFAVFAGLLVMHVQPDRVLSAALNLFLIVVLIASIRWGTRYAIFLAILSALVFSWSLPPVGHFHWRDGRVWTLLTACLVAGIIAGQLSDRARRATLNAKQRRADAVAEQQRYRDLVNSVEGIVWEADAETFVFSFVSDQAQRILGYPTEKWLSEPTFWRDHLHPEDRDRAVQLCVQATAENCSHDFEYRMIAADGRVVWMRDLVTVVVENGHPTRLRGVMVDVTKRKENEEALREQASLLSLTHDAVLVRDMNRTIAYWNRAAEELYGWRADEAKGQVPYELLKTVFPKHLKEIEAEVMSTGRWEGELVQTRKDGTTVVVASRWALAQDDKGTPIAILVTNNDISESKRAEQAREEIEEQWRAAFESNPTMYFIVDVAGAIVTVNAFGAEQLGYSVGELLGQPVLNLFHEPDRDAVQKHASACFEQPGRTWRWEARKIRKDGTMIWVRETANAVFLKKQPVLLVVCENITEQKRAEEALRRSEAYLAEAQKLSHTGSWAYKPGTSRAFYWSEEMYQIWGFDPKQGPPDNETAWRRIHPKDLKRMYEYVEDARESRLRSEIVEDHRIVLPDGTVKHIHGISHPVFDEAGQVVEYIGTAVDVTARKRAEELLRESEGRFRTSVDHLTDALFIHDDQDDRGRVIDVNQQACNSLGYTREELIGMTAFDYDPSVDVTFNLSLKERLARGEIFSFESVHRRKDGTEFPVEVRVRPFWHGDHRFGLALARDITDRKRAEAELERLRQLEADLAHTNRVTTLGELTASLAHEVNQPIAAAVTNANTSVRWLASEIPNIDEAREAAKRAAKDATRAADIINRIRSLFTKGEVQRERVDVNDIINDMIVLLRNEAMRYTVSIHSVLAADLPNVMADRVQLQQVLMNLMLNSIDAMKGIDGTRELTLVSQRAGSGQVLVSVSDNGVGLPADIGPIFNAFFTTKPHGTGMGLAISRTIIESHGGRLWATSNSGHGATFYFTLRAKIEAQV